MGKEIINYIGQAIQSRRVALKLVTFKTNGEERIGAVESGNVIDLNLAHELHLSAPTERGEGR